MIITTALHILFMLCLKNQELRVLLYLKEIDIVMVILQKIQHHLFGLR